MSARQCAGASAGRDGSALALGGLPAAAHDSGKQLAALAGLGLCLVERSHRQGLRQGMGSHAAEGLSHAQPAQHRRRPRPPSRATRPSWRAAAGGRCPTSSCSRAAVDPAVALLRERLLMSDDLQGSARQLAELRLLCREGREALSGLERAGAHRHRRQAHDCGTERDGRRPAEAADDQSRASHRTHARRPARSTWWSTFRPHRSRRSRTTRWYRGTPASSASPTGRRRILKSAIHELNFNAVWHLPPTVIEKDLIPKGRRWRGAARACSSSTASTPTAATARSSTRPRSTGPRRPPRA